MQQMNHRLITLQSDNAVKLLATTLLPCPFAEQFSTLFLGAALIWKRNFKKI